jgi:hypothetical protein
MELQHLKSVKLWVFVILNRYQVSMELKMRLFVQFGLFCQGNAY